MKRQQIIMIFAAMLLSGTLMAQHNEQVTIEGTYRPKATKVEKIKLTPETPEQSYEAPDTDVDAKDIGQKFDIELEKLSPTKLSSKFNATVKPAQNFLLAGIGSRISPLFVYTHDSRLGKSVDFGLGLKHYSSWMNMKPYAPSSFMDNEIEAKLDAKLSDYQLDNRFFYKSHMVHYYGYRLSDSLFTDEQLEVRCPRQVYNSFGISTRLSSTDTHLETLQHFIGLDIRHVNDIIGAKENFVDLKGGLSYSNNWWGERNAPQTLGADIDFVYDRYAFARLRRTNRILFKFNPYFSMIGDFYKLRLGALCNVVSTDGRDGTEASVHPDIKGSLYVFDKKTEFYAGMGGGRSIYSYYDVVEDNPFANPLLDLQFRNEMLTFEAGVRTSILQCGDIHVGVRYANVENDNFFLQSLMRHNGGITYVDDTIYNSYVMTYDDATDLKVLFNARYKCANALGIEANLVYDKCTPAKEEHAWYRPSLTAELKGSYDLSDEWSFSLSAFYAGGRYAQHSDATGETLAVKLNDIIDIAAGADFRVNEQLSVFAKVDNLANCKYQLYYDYPVTGVQVFGGIKMTF